MDIILIVIVLLLSFGCGIGYTRYGAGGRFGIGGVLLLILIIYLIFGPGRL